MCLDIGHNQFSCTNASRCVLRTYLFNMLSFSIPPPPPLSLSLSFCLSLSDCLSLSLSMHEFGWMDCAFECVFLDEIHDTTLEVVLCWMIIEGNWYGHKCWLENSFVWFLVFFCNLVHTRRLCLQIRCIMSSSLSVVYHTVLFILLLYASEWSPPIPPLFSSDQDGIIYIEAIRIEHPDFAV